MSDSPTRRLVPFAYGFRPFFLLAGLYGVISVAAWLWMFLRGAAPPAGVAPRFWHGHEMVFGFVAAAIAGFLLTAVPSWTGRRGFAGKPLMLLTLLWISGRVAFVLTDTLPWTAIVAAELAFLPAIMFTIGPSLLRTINHNTPLLLLLFALWVADAAFLYGISANDTRLVTAALRGGLDVVLVLVTIIGGRIVPAFTGNALKARGITATMHRRPTVEYLILPAMLTYAISDVINPYGKLTAVVAAVACLLHLWRLSGWHGLKTASQPIVWVLHVAYLWLPTGLFLKTAAITTGATWAAHWQHALGAGAAATMIIAVMTRASLGHTGRPLEVPTSITVAYGLLVTAVLARVFGPALPAISYATTMVIAGALWMLSFGVYVLVYAPILLGPRVDGKPG